MCSIADHKPCFFGPFGWQACPLDFGPPLCVQVYRARWKGAVVALKVAEHRVQDGTTHDLSREPLLRCWGGWLFSPLLACF
jgi:hypothetical protein